MTEDSGFAYAPPAPPAASEPAPEATPTPVPVEEAAPAPEAPAAVPAPSVPDNQPQWLKDLVAGLHERLVALEQALADKAVAALEKL